MARTTFTITFEDGTTASQSVNIFSAKILDGFWSDPINGGILKELTYGEKAKFTVKTQDIPDDTKLSFILYDFDSNYNPDDELDRTFSTIVKNNMAELEFIPDSKWQKSAKYETDKVVEVYFKIEAKVRKKNISTQLPKREEDYLKIYPKKLLYLLFYVSNNDHGDEMFAEAAETRLRNIKNSSNYNELIHKVHCIPIQDISEIIQITETYLNKYGGNGKAFSKEIGIWSHSGYSDGPIGTSETSIDSLEPKDFNQMKISGWAKIKFNWAKTDPLFVMYGCNSGRDDTLFAQRLSLLSSYKNVEVWGQSDSSFPSKFPDYRRTSIARTIDEVIPLGGFDVGYTYMIAGNDEEGWNSQTLNPVNEYPKANPMNCYKNGSKIRTIHQGYFNDHRKKTKLKIE